MGTYQELENDQHLMEVVKIYKKQNDENVELRDCA
jgi:hypothetical protein